MTTSPAAAHVIETGVLDADSALALLEEVVAEKGTTYNTNDGVYFQGFASPEHAATPIDLIGHVFDKLGKTAHDLTDIDDPHASPESINNCWISSIGIDGIEISDEARTMFYEAQTSETGGRNWGGQLEAAQFAHTNRRGFAILAAAA